MSTRKCELSCTGAPDVAQPLAVRHDGIALGELASEPLPPSRVWTPATTLTKLHGPSHGLADCPRGDPSGRPVDGALRSLPRVEALVGERGDGRVHSVLCLQEEQTSVPRVHQPLHQRTLGSPARLAAALVHMQLGLVGVAREQHAAEGNRESGMRLLSSVAWAASSTIR